MLIEHINIMMEGIESFVFVVIYAVILFGFYKLLDSKFSKIPNKERALRLNQYYDGIDANCVVLTFLLFLVFNVFFILLGSDYFIIVFVKIINPEHVDLLLSLADGKIIDVLKHPDLSIEQIHEFLKSLIVSKFAYIIFTSSIIAATYFRLTLLSSKNDETRGPQLARFYRYNIMVYVGIFVYIYVKLLLQSIVYFLI